MRSHLSDCFVNSKYMMEVTMVFQSVLTNNCISAHLRDNYYFSEITALQIVHKFNLAVFKGLCVQTT